MIFDYIKYAYNTFQERKTRTFLTMLGIFIGIAAVVSLISLGQGLQYTIDEQFKQMGVDKLMVFPGQNAFALGTGGEIKLTDDDINTIEKTPGVDLVGGFIYKVAKVLFKEEQKYTFVIGLPQDETKKVISSMQNFKVKTGRDLESADKYNALIGIELAEGDFFEKKAALRDKITINENEFKVVGIMDRIGNPQDDSQAYIPLETAKEILDSDNYGMLIVQAKAGEDVNKVAENIKKSLRNARDVEKDEEDFSVQTSEQLIESFQRVFTIVQAVLIGIAAISLLVGGIGIMNTMYTSVLQRTPEIGLMKAVGARNSDIMKIFLIESGILGLIGGIIGVIGGIGLSKLVELIAANYGVSMLKAYFPWYLTIGALMFAILVGIISGILPAQQAAKMEPVEALRYSE